MNHPTIGIIGAGTVGRALTEAFSGHCEILTNDPARGPDSRPLEELVTQSSVIFVCVPTPMAKNGDADLEAFHSVMDAIARILSSNPGNTRYPVVCIRSAVPPDAIQALIRIRTFAERLVVGPEFLRERSPVEDMLSMRSLVLGGDRHACEAVSELFHMHSNISGPMRTSILPDAIAAAFLKYQENAFLALKVSFMNEFHDVYVKSGTSASWAEIQTAFHQDHERMGMTHWSVPGPDGLRGWGGRCLPKDVSAFQAYAKRLGTHTPLLDAMRSRNMQDRARPVTPTASSSGDSAAKRQQPTYESQQPHGD